MSLTGKQAAFVEAYCRNGQNASKAAEAAEYKGNRNTIGSIAFENMQKPAIKEAISVKLAEIKAVGIANREQRQAFWTALMQSPNASNSDKLRASELLGRSEADFTDNVTNRDGGLSIRVASEPRPVLKAVKGA